MAKLSVEATTSIAFTDFNSKKYVWQAINHATGDTLYKYTTGTLFHVFTGQ
jgi:hypothetical protein